MLFIEQLKERYRIIIGYVGTIIIGVGVVMFLPLTIIFAYPDEISTIPCFSLPAISIIILGLFFRKIYHKREDITLTITEGGIIVIFSWFIAMFFSSIPFLLGTNLNFTQAFFESVSGWTTTGLSVINVKEINHVFLLWRSLMQFFGGAGIAVIMMSAIIGPLGTGLYHAEARTDKLLPNVIRSTKLITKIYFSYTMAGFLLYVLAGMPWFDSIIHSLSALSTGGFSSQVESIGFYNNIKIEAVSIVLMLLGTTNFGAHYLLLRGNFRKFFKIGEVRLNLVLLSLSIPIVTYFFLINIYGSIGKSIRVGIFEIVSALSTTGYSTTGYLNWPAFPFFVLIILMIIGGGTGSTAGGFKQYRFLILLKSLYWNIKRFFLPDRIVTKHYVNRPDGKFFIPKSHFIEISNFFTLYIITFSLGTLIISSFGYELKDAMFEFASALGTVGLSIGITSASAPKGVLWTQIVGMILGRLEFMVVFYAIIKIFRDMSFIARKK
jgi:trk system potassium uptake protein TrkH